MKQLSIVLIATVLASLHTFGAERLSADATPLPAVTVAAPPFKANLPLVRDKLGALPEELGFKIYSTGKSKALLARRIDPKSISSEWFGWGLGGADVIGVDIDSTGRVYRLTLVYQVEDANRTEQIQAGMARVGKAAGTTFQVKNRVTDKPLPIIASGTPNSATFCFEPVEWYLLTQPQPKEIADAMRSQIPVLGMTLEQMGVMFGIEQESTTENGVRSCVWVFKRMIKPSGQAGVRFSGPEYHDALQSQLMRKPEYEVARTITGRFVGGKLVEFEDKKY